MHVSAAVISFKVRAAHPYKFPLGHTIQAQWSHSIQSQIVPHCIEACEMSVGRTSAD
jgi:hypothetical protein